MFAIDCSQLVKMVPTPIEFPAFTTHMEEFSRCKEYFQNFAIQQIPKAQNTMDDMLARSVRSLSSAMVMLIQFHRIGFWVLNLLRIIITFC